jgi:hypothetical protein
VINVAGLGSVWLSKDVKLNQCRLLFRRSSLRNGSSSSSLPLPRTADELRDGTAGSERERWWRVARMDLVLDPEGRMRE